MKKLLFSLPFAMPLALCLTGCPSTIGNDALNSVSSNTTTNDATSNDAASNAVAAQSASPKATATKTATAKPSPKVAARKTYRIVDEAQPSFPPAIVEAIHKLAVAPPPDSMKVPDKARVVLATSKGDITVELNGKAAPLHVKSFLYLSGKGFYNGTTFHRYEPCFVIQGGDPLSKDLKYRQMAGSGGPGYQIPREYNSLKHNAMMLAMARTSDPDSAGSQFYFTLAPATFLDKENSQDGFGYTVFGKVVKGQNVVLQLRQDDILKRATVAK